MIEDIPKAMNLQKMILIHEFLYVFICLCLDSMNR